MNFNIDIFLSGFALLLVTVFALNISNKQDILDGHIFKESANKDVVYVSTFVDYKFPFIHKEFNIQMTQEIKDDESVRDIVRVLQIADKNDKVTFHLAGYGGSVETVYELINNIQNSKANVIMSVEAPVYSGHAYLASNKYSTLKINPLAFLMFHTSTEYNEDCSKEIGSDRNMTNEEHCNIKKYNDMLLLNKEIQDSKYLTQQEKDLIRNGKDVYLQANEIENRNKMVYVIIKDSNIKHYLYLLKAII